MTGPERPSEREAGPERPSEREAGPERPPEREVDVRDLSVRLGPVDVLTRVSFTVSAGSALGLVGANGAGKTTLLDAVSGFVPVTSGSVWLAGTDVTRQPAHRRARLGLGRTFQALELFDDLTVDENLQVVADAVRPRTNPRAMALKDTRLGARLPRTLAHAERKTVALARALAGGPRVLLLDEPAAGLDAAARQALVAALRGLVAGGLAVVVADHDLDLVLAVCDRVLVLDLGKVIADLPPSAVRSDARVISAYLGRGSDPAAASRSGPAPRSEGRSGPAPRSEGRSGPGDAVVLEARGLAVRFGGALAVEDLDLDVREGEVVALLGPNGAGKTTTLRALSGSLPLAGGTATAFGVPVGRAPHRLAKLGLAYVPQDRAVLPSLTVAENLRLAARGRKGYRAEAVAHALKRFPVLVPLLKRPAGRLSGGEQQLLALARALAAQPRLLLVDELSMGLAVGTASTALTMLRELADGGAGVLLVEQHPVLAMQVADRVVVLALGRAVFNGPPATLTPRTLEAAYLGRSGPS